MTGKEKLLKWQPKAKNILDAGKCDNCKNKGFLFYQLDGDWEQEKDDWLQGGFYCPNCGFGNAGAMPKPQVQS